MTSLSIALECRSSDSLSASAARGSLAQQRETLLVIDAGVDDYPRLVAGAWPGVEVLVLAAGANGLDQITAYLKTHPASTVHIVSHGAPGRLWLGHGELNLDNLNTHAEALSTWFQADNAELLLYGCNVAAGDAGAEFLEKLHRLTGATIAASTSAIGNGQWELNTHDLTHPPIYPPIHSSILTTYPHTLATYVVDTNSDENDGNYSAGNLSLREAIALANDTPEDDTITFGGVFTDGNTTNDTILLTSQLTLTSNITIDGSGGDPVTISGGDATRVFYIGSGATVALHGFTIANGKADRGGGIYNDSGSTGSLSLDGMTFSGNSAISYGGGLYNYYSTITSLSNSTFSGNSATSSGGGLFNYDGTITSLSNSTFSGNSASEGGGLNNYAGTIATLSNSTFSGNSAQYYGGGLVNNRGTITTLSNSTFSGNSAQYYGGGLFNYAGTIATLSNSLFSNNSATYGGTGIYTSGGEMAAPTSSMFANSSLDGVSLGSNSVEVADALIGPLANNGGPTQTHALLPGSSAINAATGGTTTDQRGVAVYGTRDIGAYEYNPFVVTNTNDSGVGSLRWAIDNANATPGDDTITFAGVFTDGDTSNDTIILTSQLTLDSNLTINGSGGDPITVSGNNATRVFYVNGGATVALNGFTIANGKTDYGGGIYNASGGSLSLEGMTFSGNSAQYGGGGIFNNSYSTITSLSNSTFSGNSAQIGGGILNAFSTITSLSNSTFSGNSAQDSGGGIFNDYGTIASLSNSTFSGNSAQYGGGGIYNNYYSTIASLSNSTFSGNSAQYYGGGILNAFSTITSLSNSTFSGNSATYEGGGIYNNASTINSLSNSTFSGNSATYEGGGIYNNASTIAVTHSLFADSNLYGYSLDSTNQSGTTTTLGLDPILRDNGGPTQTHALLAYSPAIDAAMNGTTTDQRGVAAYGTRDVGAYEVQNDAPTSANASATLDEDTTHVFQASNFTFNDPDGGSFLDLKITHLPSTGQLFLDGNDNGTQDTGEAVTLDQIIPLANLSQLSFRPVANANGNAYTTFGFQVGDGTSLSQDAYIYTLNVTPVNDDPTGSVTITGTATQGETLTASNNLTDLDGIPANAITYTWLANGTSTGVTGNTYTLTQADVGKVFTVKATYTDSFGQAEVVISDPTSAVANSNDLPSGTVTISGTATQGQTLTATDDLTDLDGIPTNAITYTWLANGTSTGVTGNTYPLTQADVGKVFTVKATYTDSFGQAESVTSASVTIANLNDSPTGTVTLSGEAKQGYVLTAHTSTLADMDGLGAFSYQWQQFSNGQWSNISEATNAAFPLTQAQVGQSVRVQVSYTDGQNTLEQVWSQPTATPIAPFKSASDFNGDGQTDILWRNAALGSTVVWGMSSTTIQVGQSISPSVDSSWQVGAVTDFDRNGSPDLLWQNTITGDSVFWLFDGLTVTHGVELPRTGPSWQVAGADDFTGDGQADLLWRNAISGENVVWQMHGSQPVTAISLPTVSTITWDIRAVGDFSRDDQADILWRNTLSGETVVWQMEGGNPVGAVTLPTVPVEWELHGAADFTGDTHLDLLWHNQTSGELVIWTMQGLTPQSSIALPSVDPSWEAVLS